MSEEKSKGKMYMRSEAYAKDLEAGLEVYIKKTVPFLEAVDNEANRFFSLGIEGREKLRELFGNEDYRYILEQSDELVYLCQIMDIHEHEHTHGLEKTILDISGDRKTLETLIRKIRYAIFKIEFDEDNDNAERLCNLIRETGISPVAISMMVGWTAYSKLDVCLKLSKIFMNEMMIGYSKAVLDACKEL